MYNQQVRKRAGVVQWQYRSFPSFGRGFDSHRPLQKSRSPCCLDSSRTLKTFPATTLLVCVRPHVLQLPCESGLADRLSKGTHLRSRSQAVGRAGPGESIVDIQEIDTYTPANRRSTDLLAGVVQHPKNQCRWRKEHELFQTVY